MAIVTRRRTSEFAIIPNAVADDNRLSFEARGLLCYLLAKPHDWKVNVADIQDKGGIGRDKAYRILNDLKAAGYIEHRVERDGAGRIVEHEYVVHDTAVPARLPLPENQELEKPHPENPEVVEPLPDLPDLANPASGFSGRINKNEEIQKTHSPLPPETEPPTEPTGDLFAPTPDFADLWRQVPDQHRPASYASAQKLFDALASDGERRRAIRFFDAYRLLQFKRGKPPTLMPYLRDRLWIELDGAPATDDKGRYVITPDRPEWTGWLAALKRIHGPRTADHHRTIARVAVETRWPPNARTGPGDQRSRDTRPEREAADGLALS